MFAMCGIPTNRGGATDVVSGHIAADTARKRIETHKANCGIRAVREATVPSLPAMEETVPSSSSHEPMPEIRDGGDDESGQAEPMPEIRQRGYDDRGWAVLDCLWSGPGVKIAKMKIRNGKPLELVLEESVPLRV